MAGLEQFLEIGRITEEVKVLGREIAMKVLSSGEQQETLEATLNLDDLARGNKLMLETLARAIVSINGVKVQYRDANENILDRRETIRRNGKLLEETPFPVISELWTAYQNLVEKQSAKIEQLKKVQTSSGPEASGEPLRQSVSKKSFPSTQ